MRYRKLSPTGDYVMGGGTAQFLVNSPEAVAQAVETRLKLFAGEWFLDTAEGLPLTSILGNNTQALYDQAIQERIIKTDGVLAITEYTSSLNNRALTVSATISTIYGTTTVKSTI